MKKIITIAIAANLKVFVALAAPLSKVPTNLTASNHTSSTMPSCDDDSSTAVSCPDLRAESEASGDSDSERSESPAMSESPATAFDPSFDPAGGYQSPSVFDECQGSRLPEKTTDFPERRKLKHEFWGLAVWLELEEFDNDITRAVEDFSSRHACPLIPKPHTTAIYGMTHLSTDEARERFGIVRERIHQWPTLRPCGVQVRSFIDSLLSSD